jgi:hypothetical protein
MSERWRRGWWGWTRSSEGFAVRLLGPTNLQYRDASGVLHISAEAMSKPWNNIVVYTSSISDIPVLPRAEVVDRIGRAFAHRGWRLVLAD